MAQICRGIILVQKKHFLIIKSDFDIIDQEFQGYISERNELLRCDKTNF